MPSTVICNGCVFVGIHLPFTAPDRPLTVCSILYHLTIRNEQSRRSTAVSGNAVVPSFDYHGAKDPNYMQRLHLADYLLTILIILALIFGVSYLVQSWLVRVSEETSGRMERAGRIFP